MTNRSRLLKRSCFGENRRQPQTNEITTKNKLGSCVDTMKDSEHRPTSGLLRVQVQKLSRS